MIMSTNVDFCGHAAASHVSNVRIRYPDRQHTNPPYATRNADTCNHCGQGSCCSRRYHKYSRRLNRRCGHAGCMSCTPIHHPILDCRIPGMSRSRPLACCCCRPAHTMRPRQDSACCPCGSSSLKCHAPSSILSYRRPPASCAPFRFCSIRP